MAQPRYWLFKSEPTAYSFDNLMNEPDRTAEWDGVRNYQARNFMRDDMKVGDRVLFYHSSAKPLAVVGTATVVREGYPDATAWDPNDRHYDPKSSPGTDRLGRCRHPGRPGVCPSGHPGRNQGKSTVAGHAADPPRYASSLYNR